MVYDSAVYCWQRQWGRSIYSCVWRCRLVDKDTGSQSSTDTAMSSESPNQSGVKHEPPEAVENGEAEVQPSPRKKPRKQLLW